MCQLRLSEGVCTELQLLGLVGRMCGCTVWCVCQTGEVSKYRSSHVNDTKSKRSTNTCDLRYGIPLSHGEWHFTVYSPSINRIPSIQIKVNYLHSTEWFQSA